MFELRSCNTGLEHTRVDASYCWMVIEPFSGAADSRQTDPAAAIFGISGPACA